ncbi:hypothetical protein WJX72_006727 [[Myrmecia] bisecta]|uniref:BZIP domain-containing protein n=1 Tax=[Myrmecia] bisecta TaxID=41462 RepID=A0AAW1Q1B7_9CHLO
MGSNESVRSVRTRGKGPGSAAKQAMSAAEKEARRTLALQEKNRRAQRRFRERQKSRVATLEAEVDELKQQLHASNQGRDELERQNQALQQLQLQQAQHTKQARHGGQPSGSQRDPETEQCDEDKLVRTIREGQETMLTLEQVQQLAPKALTRIWKEYVGQLAACLAKMESKPLAPVPRCLIRLTSEASMLLQRMAAGNPLATKTLIAGELEGEAIQPCMGPQEGPNRWPLVGRALNLSSQQASELMELRRRLLSNLSCILQQRREVIQHMRAVPTAHYTTGHFLEAQESLEQLQANLKQEHLLITEFVSAVHSRILSPTQLARCLVQSYPRAPDTLAIATWVASACGEADSGAMLVPPTSSCMPALDNALGLQRAPGSASLPMFGSPFQDTPLRRHHSAASPGRPPQAVHIRMAPARAPPPGLHLTGSAPTAVYSGAALHSTSSPAPSGTTITTALPCWTRLQ